MTSPPVALPFKVSTEAFVRDFGSFLCGVDAGGQPRGGLPGTCTTCGTPVASDYVECYTCHQDRALCAKLDILFPVDEAAFLTYAVDYPGGVSATHEREGRQTYRVLKGYKAVPPVPGALPSLIMWTLWFLEHWWPSGTESTSWAWATVPSRKTERLGPHPLRGIIAALLKDSLPEVVLTLSGTSATRGFDTKAFVASGSARDNHVLLIEDLWVTGGNVLSAAAALKSAGAERVSAMALGRALNPSSWEPARQFIEHDGLRQGFSPGRSPWVKTA